MIVIGIYKITNPKGKVYVGQSIDIKNRKYKYQTACCKSQTKIYNSIKKYGWINYSFEILVECNVSELNEKEIYYIDFYNSFKNGLNSTVGGNSSLLSQEHKAKISNSLKGKSRLFCTLYKVKMTKKLNPVKMSDDNKKRLSDLRNPNFLYSNNKPVIDLINGIFYDSLKEVSNLYNINYNTLKGRLNGSKINNTNFIYA